MLGASSCGGEGPCGFLSKCGVVRYAHKSPIMKWANPLKESSKNSLNLNAASHNTTSWYTETDRFLLHSPNRGSLYYKGPAFWKIISGFFDPLCTQIYICTHIHIHIYLHEKSLRLYIITLIVGGLFLGQNPLGTPGIR